MLMIKLAWPDKVLSPNARAHWAVKSRAVKAARSQAYWLAHMGMVELPDGPIAVRVTFHPPDKRHRDDDNMLASVKAYLDGISDAYGVNDSRFVLTIARGDPVRGGCVIVSIGA
jgi:crossover junction endodeoxyribonuclease RusA